MRVRRRPGGNTHLTLGPTLIKAGTSDPVCNENYGRWVPGGDSLLKVERLAEQVARGMISLEAAIHTVENTHNRRSKYPLGSKRDLLMALCALKERTR